MSKTKGKPQKSVPIGVDGWNLSAHEKLSNFANRITDEITSHIQRKLEDAVPNALDKMIREGLKIATKEYDCVAWMAVDVIVSARSPKDPTTIYVDLPLGDDDDASPRWSFSLTKIVRDMISGGTDSDGKYIDNSRDLGRLSRALRVLADEVERASNGVGIKP